MDARVTPLGGEHTFSSHSLPSTQSAHKRTHQSRTDKLKEKRKRKQRTPTMQEGFFVYLFVLFIYFLFIKNVASFQRFLYAHCLTDSRAKYPKTLDIFPEIIQLHVHCLLILMRVPILWWSKMVKGHGKVVKCFSERICHVNLVFITWILLSANNPITPLLHGKMTWKSQSTVHLPEFINHIAGNDQLSKQTLAYLWHHSTHSVTRTNRVAINLQPKCIISVPLVSP